MKTPLCTFCIKSGVLCPQCRDKLRTGTVSERDIHIAKLLFELEAKYPVLQQITFHNAYDVDGVLAIVVGPGDLPRIFSEGSAIPRAIADLARKRIRILEKRGDTRGFLEDLLAPAPITAINTIWLPDGTTETRVIVSGRPRRLPLKVSVLRELAKKVRGITLRVAFER